MKHAEIILALKKLVKVHNDVIKFESTIPNAQEHKKKSFFSFHFLRLISLNTENGGSLEKDLTAVILQLGKSQPDFRPIENMSKTLLQQYSETTAGLSSRMEGQLELLKLLEVKDLFKVATDTFVTQNIVRVENILKEMK